MNDIKAKIKELERLQKKVDFLKQVIDFPTKLKPGDEDEKVVLPEVQELIKELLEPIIESLEKGESTNIIEKTDNNTFTESEVEILKKLAARAEKAGAPKVAPKIEQPEKPKKGPSAWVLANQSLGGKRVKTMVLSSEVEGEVISLNEPFAVIKLENGKIHQATLDKIKVL